MYTKMLTNVMAQEIMRIVFLNHRIAISVFVFFDAMLRGTIVANSIIASPDNWQVVGPQWPIVAEAG